MEGLLQANLIKAGDAIDFMFKKFHICGMVGMGGHIVNTIITTPDGKTMRTLVNHVYPSLTAWSEACLREGLSEENMRYASWKRVRHLASDRTLQSLRAEYNIGKKGAQASRQDLYAEINRLHASVKKMTRVTPTREYPTSQLVIETDQLLTDSAALDFFRKWNGTCLGSTCLPQTGGVSD